MKNPSKLGKVTSDKCGVAMFTRDDYRLVNECLSRLNARQRTIVEMHFWDGFTSTEIAQALRMDWADVMAELGTAFRILRSQLMSHPKFSRAAQLFSAA